MDDVIFKAARGASELSANAYLLEAYGCRLLLDAGAVQGESAGWVGRIERPEACWISHAHWDHLGAAAALTRRFPTVPCLATSTTRRLAAVALSASGRAEAVAAHLQPIPIRRYVDLADVAVHPAADRFRMMVFPAGHIPGAAMIAVEIDTGGPRPFRLLYTGDFCGHDQPLIPGAMFPRTGDSFAVDVMVTEGVMATQKAHDTLVYGDQMGELIELLAGRTGPALVGVSSLGEAVPVIAACVQAGVRPTVHARLRAVLAAAAGPSVPEIRQADEAACRRALSAGDIVIAPGEQFGPGTPSGRLLGAAAGRDDARIVVLNRAFERSIAGQLIAADAGEPAHLNLGAGSIPLAAGVEHVLLPNHAPRRQLVGAVQAVAPRRVVLVHGHRSHLFALKRAVQKAGFDGTIDVPENDQPLTLRQ